MPLKAGSSTASPWGPPARLPDAEARAVARARAAAGTASLRPPADSLFGQQNMPRRRLPTPAFRVTRATAALVVIALGMGLALAAAIGLVIYLIAGVIHHAAGA